MRFLTEGFAEDQEEEEDEQEEEEGIELAFHKDGPLGVILIECEVSKRICLLRCHLILKTINLPRQARDKHRESTHKRERCVSLQHSRYKAREDEALPLRYLEVSRIVKHSEAGQVRQRGAFFSVFIDANDRFAKTRSGQTHRENSNKSGVFLQYEREGKLRTGEERPPIHPSTHPIKLSTGCKQSPSPDKTTN